MQPASKIGPPGTGPLPWTVVLTVICLMVYALVLLIQPEVLEFMGVRLGGRTRAHMMARLVLVVAITWGLVQTARWAWWAATIFTVLGSIMGILGVIFPGRYGHVLYLADTVIAPFAILAIMTAAFALLLPRTQAAFRGPSD